MLVSPAGRKLQLLIAFFFGAIPFGKTYSIGRERGIVDMKAHSGLSWSFRGPFRISYTIHTMDSYSNAYERKCPFLQVLDDGENTINDSSSLVVCLMKERAYRDWNQTENPTLCVFKSVFSKCIVMEGFDMEEFGVYWLAFFNRGNHSITLSYEIEISITRKMETTMWLLPFVELGVVMCWVVCLFLWEIERGNRFRAVNAGQT